MTPPRRIRDQEQPQRQIVHWVQRRLAPVLGGIAGAALFVMMCVTLVDVLGRKLLDRSLPGAVELTEFLLLLLIFLALPVTTLYGEHVIFDLLDKLMPPRWRRWLHRLANAICVAIMGGAAWLVFERAQRTAQMQDYTPILHLPLAPLHYAAAAFLGLDALMHLYLALRATPGSDAFHVAVAGSDDA
jgi:TRAP-type C4-dicarboxylate transport system permease small subunit